MSTTNTTFTVTVQIDAGGKGTATGAYIHNDETHQGCVEVYARGADGLPDGPHHYSPHHYSPNLWDIEEAIAEAAAVAYDQAVNQ